MLKLNHPRHSVRHYFLTGFLFLLVSCSANNLTEQQMLDKAKTYLADGKLRAATIELRNTLQKNSNNAEARYLLGSIGLKIDYLASAEKELRRAAQAGWDVEQTQLKLARVLIARRKYQELLDDITLSGTWSATTRANISALRAIAEANLNQLQKAKTTLIKSEALNPDAFLVLKAKTQFQLSHLLDGDASETLDKALLLFPDNDELLLLYATNDLQKNNIAQSIDTLKKIIARSQANILTRDGRKARIDLARIQIMSKHYSRARSTLSPLLKKDNKDPIANYLISLLAFSQGNYDEAERHIRKLLKLAPDHNQSQQLMGNIKFLLHDYDQAAYYLTSSLIEKPDSLPIYTLLTRTYIAQNKPAQAMSTIKKALAISPNDQETLFLLSQLKFGQGNNTAGINTLRQAIKLNPKSSVLQKQLAVAYINIDEPEKALREIDKFQRLSHNKSETQKLYIRAYLQALDLSNAIKTANELLAENPRDPNVISLIGNLHTARKDYKQARHFFTEALQLEKNFAPAINGLAHLEAKVGNFDRSAALYNRLIDAGKDGTAPMLALANLAQKQGQTNDMIRWLEKAREFSPTDIKSRTALASYYLQTSRVKTSNKYIQEAIIIAPENPALLLLQGKILIAQNRFNEALPPLKTLVNKLPDLTEARILLGKTFLHLQMPEAARKHLRIALDNQENNALALGLLATTELQDNHLNRSLQYARRLQSVKPEHHLGYTLEGEVWLKKQNYNRALSSFNKAWQRTKSAEIVKKIYAAARHVKSFDNAIKPLLSWLDNHPDDSAMRLVLAFAYLETGHNKAAIREYESILKKMPENSTVLNNLAWLYSLTESPKALYYAEKAYRFSPENPGVLDTYGWTLVQQNQTEKGKRLLDLAMTKLPGNLDIQYHYAVALTKSGKRERARKILKKLIDDGRNFTDKHNAELLLEKITSKK